MTYANEVKRDLLGVPEDVLDEFGAVSPEVARQMADGARERLHTDVGVGITGVAGPGGGTADKPVGLVYVCASSAGTSLGRRLMLSGSRAGIRARTVVVALHLVRELLEEC